MTDPAMPETDKPMDPQTKEVVDHLMAALAHNIPDEELNFDGRAQTVFEFLDSLGRLVSVMEGMQPTPGRAAAMLVMTEKLSLDSAGLHAMKVMVTLQEALKLYEKRKKGLPS